MWRRNVGGEGGAAGPAEGALKIAETQAHDIQIGQPAEIDTHNGVIQGQCDAN
jgi:hypothetical protein